MNTSLKANLLKHLIAKKEEGGFTLIELLVVIIIIGILAAIALPSFLNQANRARQSEATTYIGSMNRAQQAYYLERSEFTDSLGALGLGIAAETEFYNYDIDLDDSDPVVTNQAQPALGEDAPVKAYLGGVAVSVVDTGNDDTEATTIAGLCEGETAPVNDGPEGEETVSLNNDGQIECPSEYIGTGGAVSADE